MKYLFVSLLFLTNSAFAGIEGDYVKPESADWNCTYQTSPDAPIFNEIMYTEVAIQKPASSRIQITLRQLSSPFQPQIYICDSQEHVGDGWNTGDRYTAECTQDSIRIQRIFKQLKYPNNSVYTKSGENLKLVESFEGSSSVRICEFIPAR